jgi:putative acetyltransferase
MERELEIRESVAQDRVAIEALYPRAFADEDLLPLVGNLLADPGVTVSLVAILGSAVVGNIIFTKCSVDGCDTRAALLAPLAVDPTCQGKGIGSALVQAGLRRLQEDGISMVFVLGDPAYYSRFGFRSEPTVGTPYPLPTDWADAWQSLRLGDTVELVRGKLSVPEIWLDPALWSD